MKKFMSMLLAGSMAVSMAAVSYLKGACSPGCLWKL